MNPEIEEALEVLGKLLRDVKAHSELQRDNVDRAHDKANHLMNEAVKRTIPSLDRSVFKALKRDEPNFASRFTISRAFGTHTPRWLGLFGGRGKNYQNDLDFVQIQYKAHLTARQNGLPAFVVEEENSLQQLLERIQKLESIIHTLERLQRTGGELTDQLRDVIRRLAGSSYNYSREKQDPYTMDEFYFEEDWSLLGDLATELFVVYEAFQAEEALAQENLVPEQLVNDNTIEWIHHSEAFPPQIDTDADRFSQPVAPEEIKTDDSLGYFS